MSLESETSVTRACQDATPKSEPVALPLGDWLVLQGTDAEGMTALGGVSLAAEPHGARQAGEATSDRCHSTPVATTSYAAGTQASSSSAAADAAMDRFADGENAAFVELYPALAPRLYAYALRLTHDKWQAEDLVQHTFEMMCAARGRFIRGSRTMPWAISILRNRHLALRRRPKLEEFFPDGLHDGAHAGDGPDPTECAERKQLDALVHQELATLPVCQRDACELFYYAGLTQAEVSEVLDTSVAAVKSRVQRATDALRSIFQSAFRNDDE
jgi:RNA polymerase sigma-70 factor (ECF subfamily)